MDITTVFGDDDELLDFDRVAQALGPPGKPLTRRTVSRYITEPDGLSFVMVGGRKFVRLSVLRDFVRRREHYPPKRRGRGGAHHAATP